MLCCSFAGHRNVFVPDIDRKIAEKICLKVARKTNQDFSFDDLIFYQVTQKNDFEDWASKNIRIEMRNGIIIRLTVLTRNHSYWVNVALDTSVMPTVEAYEFVKNNGFLYDGWYFELPQPVGSRLFGL